MEKTPLVSVIIPTHNRAALVVEAIDSVLRQTYAQLEVLVVDDGSTDETPEVLRQQAQKDPRVRFVRHENRGVAAARNTGLSHARGELIGFCDSDDVLLSRKLERQVAYLADHPEAGMVYSDVRLIRDGQVETASYFSERAPREGWVFPDLLERNFIPNVSILARKAGMETAGRFNESLRSSEDYDFWLRFCQLFQVGYLPEVLVDVRQFGDNLTQEGRHYETHLQVLKSVAENGVRKVSPMVIRRAYARTYLSMGYDFLVGGRFSSARAAFLKSWRYNPASWRLYRCLLASFLQVRVQS